VAMLTYADAMGVALERLQGLGFEHGPRFVNHAPMAAEALARMGCADEVPAWVEHNLRVRQYHERPRPRWRLSADEAEWRPALGDFDRVADWAELFERELADQPWREVLARWWPRLMPGMSGALTHGVIRTAHAVRALVHAGDDGRLQRTELAQGLGYWAARYTAERRDADLDGEARRGAAAIAALDTLVADNSGFYVRAPQGFPVPLIHAITAPAAVRLVCEHLPEEQRWPSYEAALRTCESIKSYFAPAGVTSVVEAADAAPPDEAELVAAAVETGDEHAIKLAEVAVRHNALAPDARYAVASRVATASIGRLL
jgi:Questin oxidase-like